MAFRAYDPCFGCATHSPARPDAARGDHPGRARGDRRCPPAATDRRDRLEPACRASRRRDPRRRAGQPDPGRRRGGLAGRRALERGSAGDAARARPATWSSTGWPSAASRLMERLVGYERAILVDAVLGPGSARDGLVPAAPGGGDADRRATSTPPTTRPWPTALAAGRALGRTAARRDHGRGHRRPARRRVRRAAVARRRRRRSSRRSRRSSRCSTARPEASRLMHELGIAAGSSRSRSRAPPPPGRSGSRDVHLEIGEESGVAPESLELLLAAGEPGHVRRRRPAPHPPRRRPVGLPDRGHRRRRPGGPGRRIAAGRGGG